MITVGHETNGHAGGFSANGEKTLIWCLPCAFIRQYPDFNDAIEALARHMSCSRSELEREARAVA